MDTKVIVGEVAVDLCIEGSGPDTVVAGQSDGDCHLATEAPRGDCYYEPVCRTAPLVFLAAEISNPLHRPLLMAVGMVSLGGHEFYAASPAARLLIEPPCLAGSLSSNVRTLRRVRSDDVLGDQVAVQAGDWLMGFQAADVDVACAGSLGFQLIDNGRGAMSASTTQLRLTLFLAVCSARRGYVLEEGFRGTDEIAHGYLSQADLTSKCKSAGASIGPFDTDLPPGNQLRRARLMRALYLARGKTSLVRTLRMSLELFAERSRRSDDEFSGEAN